MSNSKEQPLHVRLHEEGIAPNAEAIARIFEDGDVAVLFFEVGRGPESMKAAAEAAARGLGWKGGVVEVARITATRAETLANALAWKQPGDAAAIAWLRRRSGMRLLVLAHVGSLCIDYVDGEGFDVVPGTDDADWMS